MALILNIDTATEYASVCLSRNGKLLAIQSNANQKDHASFVQPAIQRIVNEAGTSLSSIDAIAVANGPGSYTGLRVGLSTAKGLCYALDKPLILINTLEIIATAALENVSEMSSGALVCPMIDARRMEVFTAVYDSEMNNVMKPAALIVDETSFAHLLNERVIVFCGSGARKFENLIAHNNAKFFHINHDARHMQTIAEKMYLLKSFADKAYSEPYYLKEFFTPAPKLKSD